MPRLFSDEIFHNLVRSLLLAEPAERPVFHSLEHQRSVPLARDPDTWCPSPGKACHGTPLAAMAFLKNLDATSRFDVQAT